MKLRNKRTGEIVEAHDIDLIGNIYLKIFRAGDYDTKKYNSLAEFNEEWEDYEEAEFGYIVDPMEEDCICDAKFGVELEGIERAKELGIWFKTEEETEKAVEKLMAWKRLKDKGFRFVDFSKGSIEFKLDEEYSEFTYNGYDEGCEFYVKGDVQKDLELLFGGDK